MLFRSVIDNFKDGKRKEVDLFVSIPEDVEEELYFLDITTYYDWDNDEDEEDPFAYDENSNDDLDETYGFRFDVQGCDGMSTTGSGVGGEEPVISARLLSEDVMVGEHVEILASIANPSDEDMSFAVSVNDYQTWASLVSVDPSVVTLDSREIGRAHV